MAGWAGFTDEDLRQMKHGSTGEPGFQKQGQVKRQRAPNRDRIGSGVTARTQPGHTNNQLPIDPSQRLSQPEPKTKVNGTRLDVSEKKGPSQVIKDEEKKKVEVQNVPDKHEPDREEEVGPGDPNPLKELDVKEAIRVELNNEAKFLKQQKMIEEANKQKKEYLAKTINERRKKAKAESDKLGKIQHELSRLDTLLSVDVSVIRDRIEAASLDYMEAQRRYDKAEQDFIKAKMVLFDKGEMKEKLTEHLYTIIHQNEVRKANKLAELMKQLEMEVAQEEIELGIPAIPMLTNFNSVTTLHNPVKSPVSSPEAGKTVDIAPCGDETEQGKKSDPNTEVKESGDDSRVNNTSPADVNLDQDKKETVTSDNSGVADQNKESVQETNNNKSESRGGNSESQGIETPAQLESKQTNVPLSENNTDSLKSEPETGATTPPSNDVKT